MPQIHKVKILPYTPAQLFDLVADVERYPEFLPWCAAARLEKRDEKEIIGTITTQKGAFRYSFTTRNFYRYPDYMTIALIRGPFKHLSGKWQFKALENGCMVDYQMHFEVLFLLAPILVGLMDYMADTMVDSFARRAQEIYGTN